MKPTVFIGSSAESLPLARAVNENLDRDFDCVTWPHAFPLSSLTLDNLLETVDRFDYGIFVLAPDDNLALRDRNYVAASDNVVFESGLFMGRYGRKSILFIVPRDVPDLHLPSDFLGLQLPTMRAERL